MRADRQSAWRQSQKLDQLFGQPARRYTTAALQQADVSLGNAEPSRKLFLRPPPFTPGLAKSSAHHGRYYNISCNKVSPSNQVNANQHLTRAEALRIFTKGNAWFLRMEDKIGTIEAGKLADLVVLDRDYFTIPDNQIRNIRSVLTIVDGRVVHNDGVA